MSTFLCVLVLFIKNFFVIYRIEIVFFFLCHFSIKFGTKLHICGTNHSFCSQFFYKVSLL